MRSKLMTPTASRVALAGLAAILLVVTGLALWAGFESERAREPLVRALRTSAHLKSTQALAHLQAALDEYGSQPTPEMLGRLKRAERSLLRAIDTLAREPGLRTRELAADLLPRVESFRQKRAGVNQAVAAGDAGAADRIEDEELDPLLVTIQQSLDSRLPDPTRRFRQDVERFERSGRLTRQVTLIVTPVGFALLLFCAGLLRAYRRRELRASRAEAETDWLTGLCNRRRLTADLEHVFAHGRHETALILYDLDGFKLYNDTFGHPAGDALLQRLADKLEQAVAPGRAYRVGGDEFCVLTAPGSPADDVAAAGAGALSDHGEAFSVSSSWGMVAIPDESQDAAQAMQEADRRMYANKARGRASAGRQTRDVLLAALGQRQPELREHVGQVAELASAVGRRLGMSEPSLEELAQAAELHDVGKVAIPDAILDKPEPLDDEEWAFMRRHTLIGERILLAAPAMSGVARLVRSSHERWDGGGYPDGLAGEHIPLGSRIVFVCDAFHAMTTPRVYSPGRTPAEALDELARCAGSQFDPEVVNAFAESLAEPLEGAARAPARAGAEQPARRPAQDLV